MEHAASDNSQIREGRLMTDLFDSYPCRDCWQV